MKYVPIPETMYVVAGAGSIEIDGDYYPYSLIEFNDKIIYNINVDSPENCHIIYNTTYGWSINNGTIGADILYYSNIHADEPPGDSSIVWNVLNGVAPAPVVRSNIYYYTQIIGNCL